jgi:hypothetical protein
MSYTTMGVVSFDYNASHINQYMNRYINDIDMIYNETLTNKSRGNPCFRCKAMFKVGGSEYNFDDDNAWYKSKKEAKAALNLYILTTMGLGDKIQSMRKQNCNDQDAKTPLKGVATLSRTVITQCEVENIVNKLNDMEKRVKKLEQIVTYNNYIKILTQE